MNAPSAPPWFSQTSLRASANYVLSKSLIAGTDRVSHIAFRSRLVDELDLIERKIQAGTYRITRFRELLKLRGALKRPRVLSVPTYRDRTTLRALLQHLQRQLPQYVDRELPNQKVRKVGEFLASASVRGLQVARLDITDCFPSLRHDILVQELETAGVEENELAIIQAVIKTPTGSRRPGSRGVPQGISISNILAAVFLARLDAVQGPLGKVLYVRQVDDVIMIGRELHRGLGLALSTLEELGLQPNRKKTTLSPLALGATFLGYRVTDRGLSVSKPAQERLLAGIGGILSRYSSRRNHYARLRLTPRRREEILADELNEKISGAINGGKSYGWVAYYSETDDIALLKRLDELVEARVRSSNVFKVTTPKIKSLVRAYFKHKYERHASYIRDYAAIQSDDQKRAFLATTGHALPQDLSAISTDDLDAQFSRAKALRLASLEADVGLHS